MSNRSQAVRLPKEFEFTTSEVFIRERGDEVVRSARPEDRSTFLTSGPVVSKEFDIIQALLYLWRPELGGRLSESDCRSRSRSG
jgi:virulence-associated protein VagC